MNRVLVDTSVWIDYFAGTEETAVIDSLIDEQKIYTNLLILSELIPSLVLRRAFHLIDLLKAIPQVKLDIDWNKIIEYQTLNMRHNFKHIGIPDMIILDNVINNNLQLFTLDKHFPAMQSFIRFDLFQA